MASAEPVNAARRWAIVTGGSVLLAASVVAGAGGWLVLRRVTQAPVAA